MTRIMPLRWLFNKILTNVREVQIAKSRAPRRARLDLVPGNRVAVVVREVQFD